MGTYELKTARARRAAAKLEVLLAEVENGRFDLSPDTAQAIGAHIRQTLGAYWNAVGDATRDVSERQSDRRANG